MEVKPFEFIEHTADAGMLVRGDTVISLFTNAAHGLFEMIAVVDTIDEVSVMDIHVQVETIEALFVAWLDELIFKHETEDMFFKRAEILSVSSTELCAKVYGEPTNYDKHVVYTEIKAVTYHQLYVKQNPEGDWEAQVIFDL
ncbi:MAG: archease [Candidatus Poribacteria bacterium]|nr:archease [Candidatus Poribacteria bacterium]